MLIRNSAEVDRPAILAIVNDAAKAYRGVIPPDRWREPYMPAEELERVEVRHARVREESHEHEGAASGVGDALGRPDVALLGAD